MNAATTWTVEPLECTPEELSAFVTAVARDTYPSDVAETLIPRGYNPDRLGTHLNERTWYCVRDTDRTLLGVACVHVTGDAAHLGTCMVTRRGAGIGSALTRARLTWAAENGARTAEATVHAWNAASLANLAKAGFTITGSQPDGWTGHGNLHVLTAPVPARQRTVTPRPHRGPAAQAR